MANLKESGLDIDLGNDCSKDAFNWAKSTFKNRENKSGSTALDVDGVFSNMLLFGKQRIGIASDGIGTKIELAERTRIYDTLGFDLVAMVADDLATAGFEPTNISNIIDVDVLDQQVINGLMKGLAEACNFTGMSISGGEIAELGNRIGGYGEGMHFNWCSTAIGVLADQLEKPIDGSSIQEGDVVISLKSRGFRSNGFSLIRRVMVAVFGNDWHNEPYDDSTTWGEALLQPSLIYAPFINALNANNLTPAGIAHITGGGIADNFSRVLKTTGFGAHLDGLFDPLPVMTKLQALGDVEEKDAYLYWNMGNGMLLVCKDEKAEQVLQLAEEKGYAAKRAGTIIKERKIVIEAPEKKLETNY